MKSDYKAIPEMRDGEEIGVTFERQMSWSERLKIFLTGKMSWTRLTISRAFRPRAKSKYLKWFPEVQGFNHPKRMAREVKQIQVMFSKRGMRNARRRLIRMEGRLTTEERIHDED